MIEDMSWGVYDFNPFHDPDDGRFTSGHKIFSQVNKLTGTVKDSYYSKAAKILGVPEDEAHLLVDAVNYYTRHSTRFREFSQDPIGFEQAYGPGTTRDEQIRLGYIESYIDKAPKWGGGKLYRGLDLEDEAYNRLMSEVRRGSAIDLGGPSSWSSDKKTAQLFSGVVKGVDINGQKKSVIFMTEKRSTDLGTPIAHISGAPISESEVLVSGRAHFKPSGKVVESGHVVYVYGDIE